MPDTTRSTEELEAESAAFEVRNDIYAAGRYATRTIVEAQRTLDKISEGTGHDDLVQDLKDEALFCKTYAAELEKIGQDPEALAKRALALSAKFEAYLAKRRATTEAERLATDLRDRASTFLWEAMSEIRTAGSYRFRRDPAVRPLFHSAYRRRHRGGGGGTGGGDM